MHSYFYLYLYTDSPACYTSFDAAITTETLIQKGIGMSETNLNQNNFTIDEGTSHWIKAVVKDCEGNPMNLIDCHAVFTMAALNRECLIIENEVTVKLDPSETTGFLSSGYQIRLFDANDDIFQVIQGIIYIRKAHKPYIQNPLGGER